MQNIRPDLRDYIGGAGFLFDTLEQAKRTDVSHHRRQLLKLWGWA